MFVSTAALGGVKKPQKSDTKHQHNDNHQSTQSKTKVIAIKNMPGWMAGAYEHEQQDIEEQKRHRDEHFVYETKREIALKQWMGYKQRYDALVGHYDKQDKQQQQQQGEGGEEEPTTPIQSTTPILPGDEEQTPPRTTTPKVDLPTINVGDGGDGARKDSYAVHIEVDDKHQVGWIQLEFFGAKRGITSHAVEITFEQRPNTPTMLISPRPSTDNNNNNQQQQQDDSLTSSSSTTPTTTDDETNERPIPRVLLEESEKEQAVYTGESLLTQSANTKPKKPRKQSHIGHLLKIPQEASFLSGVFANPIYLEDLHLDDITVVAVSRDHNKSCADIFLNKIVIKRASDGQVFVVPCYRWISLHRGDLATHRLLYTHTIEPEPDNAPTVTCAIKRLKFSMSATGTEKIQMACVFSSGKMRWQMWISDKELELYHTYLAANIKSHESTRSLKSKVKALIERVKLPKKPKAKSKKDHPKYRTELARWFETILSDKEYVANDWQLKGLISMPPVSMREEPHALTSMTLPTETEESESESDTSDDTMTSSSDQTPRHNKKKGEEDES